MYISQIPEIYALRQRAAQRLSSTKMLCIISNTNESQSHQANENLTSPFVSLVDDAKVLTLKH